MTLRVAYVVEGFPTFIANEIRELRRQGADILLLSAFRPSPSPDAATDALVGESLYFPPGYAGVAAANLRAFLRQPLGYVGLALFLLAKGESLRLLVLGAWLAQRCRERGVAHAHGTFGTRTTTLAFVVARLSGFDFSFTTHAYDIFGGNPSLQWKTRAARFMRTISHYNRAYLLRAYPGLPPEKIRVMHLGVDVEAWPVAGPGLPGSLVCVANLVAKKGHARLLEACARLVKTRPGLSCEIVGDGPLREDLESAVVSLGLTSTVRLSGRLGPGEVRARVSRAQVFVLPSLDLEGTSDPRDGIPVALMEAMALGRAVVSTRVAGIPELVEDGVSGRLVAPDDAAALAAALEELLADGALRDRLGAAARRRVEHDFSLAANTRALALAFEEVTA